MLYKNITKEDIQDIISLAENELQRSMDHLKLISDIERYPHEMAIDEKGILGFAASEEICRDVLLVHTIVIRNEERCDKTGRCLLELIESKATEKGYRGIMVSQFVQESLLGCESDEVTFAGYKNIYDTGGSKLLMKSLS